MNELLLTVHDRQCLHPATNISLLTKDLISNFPYCLPYNSYDVSLENLVLEQLIIPLLIFFFILMISLLDIVLIL